MRRIISILALLSMMLISSIPAFAADSYVANIDVTVKGGGVVEITSETSPLPEQTVYHIDEMQTIQIEFDEPGNYVYTIQQIETTDPKIIYDETVFTAVVSVMSEEKTGELYSVTTVIAGDGTEKPAEVSFVNTSFSEPKPEPTPEPTDIPEKPTNNPTPEPTPEPTPTVTATPTPVQTSPPVATPTPKKEITQTGKVQTSDIDPTVVIFGLGAVSMMSAALIRKRK